MTDPQTDAIFDSLEVKMTSSVGAIGFDGDTEVRWVRVADVMLPRQKSVATLKSQL